MAETEALMLNALELFHYAKRHRGRLFVHVLEDSEQLANILPDLRLLQIAQIQQLIVCENYPALRQDLKRWNLQGLRLRYLPQGEDEKQVPEKKLQKLKEYFLQGFIPLFALQGKFSRRPSIFPGSPSHLLFQGIKLAHEFQATKFCILGNEPGLFVDGVFQAQPSEKELSTFIRRRSKLNITRELLRWIRQQNARSSVEIVLLEGKKGSLFHEIFSYRGRGTLFRKSRASVIRRGNLTDLLDLMLLMRPYIGSGAILPLTEEQIANDIESFFVYSVSGILVASARLVDYGKAAELAKFATLPRYQGKGRARELVEKMLAQARAQEKDYVFSLSIEPRMWQFFKKLGFYEVKRESLPALWAQSYDFDRPSRAFRQDLKL